MNDAPSTRTLARGAELVPRYGVRPLVVLSALLAVNAANRSMLAVVVKEVQASFALSDSAMGALGGAISLVAAAGVLPLGALADRATRTWMIGAAMLIAALAGGLSGAARTFAQLAIARGAVALADAMQAPASFSLLADYYPARQRGRIMALNQLGFLLGMLLAFGAGSLLAQAMGYRAALAVWALPSLVVAIFAGRLPEPARGAQDAAGPTSPALVAERGAANAAVEPRRSGGFIEIFRIRTFSVLLAVLALVQFTPLGLSFWAVKLFEDLHGLSKTQASGVISLLVVGGIVGGVGGGLLTDSLRRRGRQAARVEVTIACAVVTPLLFAPAFAARSLPVAVAFFGIGAVTCSAPFAPIAAAVADTVISELRGRATAIRSITLAMVGAAAPAVIGLLSDAIGLRAALLVTLPLSAIGGLVGTFALRSYAPDAIAVEVHARTTQARVPSP